MTFRGTRIAITRAEIVSVGGESKVRTDIMYVDDEGRAHGGAQHDVPVSTTPAIKSASADLLQALKDWAYSTHFEGHDIEGRPRERRGIAEAFQAPAEADDIAEQG